MSCAVFFFWPLSQNPANAALCCKGQEGKQIRFALFLRERENERDRGCLWVGIWKEKKMTVHLIGKCVSKNKKVLIQSLVLKRSTLFHGPYFLRRISVRRSP
jgi:hypothetical protein